MRFRVVTLNLEQDHKRWRARCRLIIEEIDRLKPDIIAFNEVSVPLQSARSLQKAAAELAGIEYNLVQQTRVNGLSKVEGEALLTRFSVVETGNLDYQARDMVALVARIMVGGMPLDAYVTHLYMSRGDDSLRLFQVQQLLAWIDTRDDVSERIVCGDFNAEPDAPSAALWPPVSVLHRRRLPPSRHSLTTMVRCHIPTGREWTDASIIFGPLLGCTLSPVAFVSIGRAQMIHRFGPPIMPAYGRTSKRHDAPCNCLRLLSYSVQACERTACGFSSASRPRP
jgi:exonuclease III